jgi:hypothetical protein
MPTDETIAARCRRLIDGDAIESTRRTTTLARGDR